MPIAIVNIFLGKHLSFKRIINCSVLTTIIKWIKVIASLSSKINAPGTTLPHTLINSKPSPSPHSNATRTFLVDMEASMYCSHSKRSRRKSNYNSWLSNVVFAISIPFSDNDCSSFYDKFLSYPTIAAISASVCEAKKEMLTLALLLYKENC